MFYLLIDLETKIVIGNDEWRFNFIDFVVKNVVAGVTDVAGDWDAEMGEVIQNIVFYRVKWFTPHGEP